MAQKGIIRNTTTAEISASDLAAVFHGLVGKSGILDQFNNLACTKISDNSVQLDSGVYSLSGYLLHVQAGTAITLTVDSGTAGQNRNDLVVAELVKNGGGAGIDTLEFKVVKGTSTSGTPADPALTQQDVNSTGVTRQEALYRVKLVGVTLTTIEAVASVVDNIDTLKERAIVESGGNATDGYYHKFGNGDMEVWGTKAILDTFVTGSGAPYNVNLASTFIEPPQINVSASAYDGSGTFTDYRASAHLNGVNSGSFFGHVFCQYAASALGAIMLHYKASGKWK